MNTGIPSYERRAEEGFKKISENQWELVLRKRKTRPL
jgi:hypothetical protein